MVRVLTDPDGFFREAAGDGRLLGPAAVVGGWSLAVIVREFAYLLRADGGGVLGQVFGALVGPPLLWVATAGALHALSMLVPRALARASAAVGDGDGDDPPEVEGGFRETLSAVGYGFLPATIGVTLVTVVAVAVAFAGPPAPFEALQARVRANDVYTVLNYLLPVYLVWSGFLWTFALRRTRGLELRTAATTVLALPAVASVPLVVLVGVLVVL